MTEVLIENPVISSPCLERTRHFRFADEGISEEPVEQHRRSSCFAPITAGKKEGKQLISSDWIQDLADL